MVWAGVILVYILNVIFKKSSEETGRSNEERPYESGESLDNPFDEIRREILRKKREREGQGEAKAEVLVESKEVREAELETTVREVDEPSQFQVHLEEQALLIKEKQAEARRLKASVEQINKEDQKGGSLRGQTMTLNNVSNVSRKVRAILGNKGAIKATLIAGEILAQPLALRTGDSARSARS